VLLVVPQQQRNQGSLLFLHNPTSSTEVSALLFRPFSKNAETTLEVVVTLQYTVVRKKIKVTT